MERIGNITMGTLSEKIELLGKGVYKDIPDTLTLHGIPTASELDIVGAEDFDKVMLDVILPQAVEEKINFRDLLEIDYQWICRCLRILNYGPYYTTNTIFCSHCRTTSSGEYRVNLNSINCEPLPPGFKNEVKISKDEFLDFNGDVVFSLPTIQQMLNSEVDKAFDTPTGKRNLDLARTCYMIKSIKGNTLTPLEVKLIIQKEFSAADYMLLRTRIRELSNYGLRAGGSTQCPNCAAMDATFIAFVDDKFFRPTMGDIKAWRADRNKREMENIARN